MYLYIWGWTLAVGNFLKVKILLPPPFNSVPLKTKTNWAKFQLNRAGALKLEYFSYATNNYVQKLDNFSSLFQQFCFFFVEKFIWTHPGKLTNFSQMSKFSQKLKLKIWYFSHELSYNQSHAIEKIVEC